MSRDSPAAATTAIAMGTATSIDAEFFPAVAGQARCLDDAREQYNTRGFGFTSMTNGRGLSGY
jgi:hypothetical protein